jgi:hypothetical protein
MLDRERQPRNNGHDRHHGEHVVEHVVYNHVVMHVIYIHLVDHVCLTLGVTFCLCCGWIVLTVIVEAPVAFCRAFCFSIFNT